ncbi:MAG: putative 2OG-Fe(II) oxygenase [Sneathiellaceae bacterium]
MGQQDLQARMRQGETLLRQGRDAEAAAVARSLAAALPQDPRPHYLLGMALARQAGADPAARSGAEAAFRQVLARAPDHPGTLLHLGLLLAENGGEADSLPHLDRFLAAQPGHARARVARANALQHVGRVAESLADYAAALALDPKLRAARSNYLLALLKAGAPARALDEAQTLLAAHPGDIRALALGATAACACGDTARYASLVDHEAWPRAAQPFGGPGAEREALHRQLVEDIRNHPTYTREWDENRRAIRGGAVALDLLQQPTPTIERFVAGIRAEVDALIAALPPLPGDPWRFRRPRRYDFVMWGNVLDGPSHQSSHIHNLGWLSGVYYVTVPPAIRADDPGHGGWIEFGRPGYGLPDGLVDPAHFAVHCPRVGDAFLFPSYYWHGTRPYEGEGERISIAYDVHVTEWA